MCLAEKFNTSASLKLTLDLIDDEFEFSIKLPGELVSTNADLNRNDSLFWYFSVKDFLNKDFQLLAHSKLKYPNRQKAVILIFIAICFAIFIWRYKKFNLKI